jgi:hypothetical protein
LERSRDATSVQALGALRIAHSDFVPAQRFLDVVKRIADLRRQRFTGHTVIDVLVLPVLKFRSTTESLP